MMLNVYVMPKLVEFEGCDWMGRPCRIVVAQHRTKPGWWTWHWSLRSGVLAPTGAPTTDVPSWLAAMEALDKNGFRALDHSRFV
jgi:hypothetical protein